MSACIICGDPHDDWRALCSTDHCAACTATCGICQAELHDGWDA